MPLYDAHLDTYNGYKLLASPIMVDRKVLRVRGGYLNRWWIRVVEVTPMRSLIVSEVARVIFGHPTVIEEIRQIGRRINARET